MSNNIDNELRDKIDKLVPCIQCDGSGGIQISEDEAEQCQYCWTLRFPAVDAIYQLVVESRIKGGMHEIAGVLSKNMDNGDNVLTNASNPRATTLNERYIELQSQLSSIGGN